MEQAYQYLLSLEFKHEYFKEGQFKSLEVSSDEETMRLIKNLGIILKPFSGGMHFLALNPELLNDATLNIPIRLFIECNDPYYINYSELPDYRPSDSVLYFHNLDSIPNSESTGLQLHKNDYVDQNNVSQLSFGKFAITNFDSAMTYHFEDIFGNDVSDKIRPAQNDSDEFLISNLPQGIVTVFAEGEEKERFYYYPRSVWKKPLGIVELYVAQLFEQFDPNEMLTYTLNFETKKTIWKYFLMDPVYQKFKNLSIVNGTNTSLFDALKNPRNEEFEHWVFQSHEPIALLEYSEETFKLVNENNASPIINALPRASPDQLYYDDENNRESIYSHIYI